MPYLITSQEKQGLHGHVYNMYLDVLVVHAMDIVKNITAFIFRPSKDLWDTSW
jgi:hypothetical protein